MIEYTLVKSFEKIRRIKLTISRNNQVACEIRVFCLNRRNSRDILISSRFFDYLFIYPFLRSSRPSAASDTDHRYWRSTRESNDSFRRVHNNLLNYRMPKVTSTRREAGVGEERITEGRWWV